MGLAVEYVTFPQRRDRSLYVARRFKPRLQGAVLDVGCFEAPLRQLIAPVPYTGIDMAGDPDITANLDSLEALPFADGSFPCVICIEVLEHLENLHHMFAELARVSSRHLIVSLPNCWGDARVSIQRGRGHFRHYGLPLEKPLDRHRWFFSLGEARAFIEAKAVEFGLEIEELFITEKPRNPLVRLARKLRYPGERYHNRYAQTLWAVLRKPG